MGEPLPSLRGQDGQQITTGSLLTLFIAASPNPASVWLRVVDDMSGAVFDQEITAIHRRTRSSPRRGSS